MGYLLILKKILWDNVVIRNALFGFLLLLILYLSYKSFYNHIYITGYNEGVNYTQKQLDDKYNKVVEKIKEENKKTAEIENQKLLESQLKNETLQKNYIATSSKLNELLKKSKSGLVNKTCKMSEEERDFLNN